MVSEVKSIKVAAVGDIFPGDHYFSLGHGLMSRTERGTLGTLFADVALVLQGADIAFCNLEGPLSRRSNQRSSVQYAAFRGVPPYSRLLKEAGFTHINVANNHILQHGPEAFEDTLQVLAEHDLQLVGLDGRRDGQISRPVVTRIRNRNVCLVGYSGVKERHAVQPIGYAHFTDPDPVIAEITSLGRQFDEVIVSCHAGDEGLAYPSPAQTGLYKRFIEAGAHCVLGHHSHVFQPVQRHGHGLIAYSLGNFVFDLFWDAGTTESAILLLEMRSQGIDWRLLATRFSTAYRVLSAGTDGTAKLTAALEAAADQMQLLDEAQYRARLERHERHNQRDKFVYFLRNMPRGHTGRKLHFLFEKFLPAVSR
jgi:poly-gamma-glutamate synthesis protein (capsule biosynthesis protein)